MGCSNSKSTETASSTAPAAKPAAAAAKPEEAKPAENAAAEEAPLVLPKLPEGDLLAGGNIKLIYFNFRGRAEVMRIMFALKKVDYEDVRVEMESWPELKPQMPNGVLPVLEVNGHKYGESCVLIRAIAKELGLDGATEEEAAKIDDIMSFNESALEPLFAEVLKKPQEEWEAEFMAMKDKFNEHTCKIEKMVQERDGGWLVGDSISYGDIAMCTYIYNTKDMYGEEMAEEKFPALCALGKKVAEIPEIADWCSKRPDTKY